MKLVAIMTIHGIPNFGSALQAFALQNYINCNIPNVQADIIDYDYRHLLHRIRRIRAVGIKNFVYNEFYGRFKKLSQKRIEKLNKFQKFRDAEMLLTKHFDNPFFLKLSKELKKYDIYLTGSDQVWNTKEVQGDTAFLLDFVPNDKPKFSFASSFGIDFIHDRYKTVFAKYLRRYLILGVRERKATEIISNLGVDVPVKLTCDPTFLLDREAYLTYSQKSDLELPDTYILVYGLGYAFNPMPALKKVINACVEKFRCKVVFMTKSSYNYDGDCMILENAGPYDFIKAFAYAKYVITSSFHGTIFSLINHIPFTPIAPENVDTRIFDLLSVVGLEKLIVHPCDESFKINLDSMYSDLVRNSLQEYIQESKKYLNEILKD